MVSPNRRIFVDDIASFIVPWQHSWHHVIDNRIRAEHKKSDDMEAYPIALADTSGSSIMVIY